MIELLLYKENLTEKEKKEINNNFNLLKIEFDSKFKQIEINKNYDGLSQIIHFYNLFEYYDKDKNNKIVDYLKNKFYIFYLENISKMIKLRSDFIIYSLMDLFYCNRIYFNNSFDNEIFVKKTFPILNMSTENLSSFIAIASIRFISILGGMKNINYLEKYLLEATNKTYVDEVNDEIRNIENSSEVNLERNQELEKIRKQFLL